MKTASNIVVCVREAFRADWPLSSWVYLPS